MTTRLPNWQSRLQAALDARRELPFAWGVHDCCVFPADCVLAMTGRDYAAAWRGRYATEREALRLVSELGGLRAIATAALGAEVSPLLAQVGDIGLSQQRGRDMLAVCGGGHWLAPGAQGLELVPPAAVVTAWRAA